MEDTSKQEILGAIAGLGQRLDQKIIGAISGLSDRMDRSEGEVMEAIGSLAEQLEDVRTDISGLKADVSELKGDMRVVKSTMVTKYYLDDHLDNFRGDLVGFIRAEDAKVLAKLK